MKSFRRRRRKRNKFIFYSFFLHSHYLSSFLSFPVSLRFYPLILPLFTCVYFSSIISISFSCLVYSLRPTYFYLVVISVLLCIDIMSYVYFNFLTFSNSYSFTKYLLLFSLYPVLLIPRGYRNRITLIVSRAPYIPVLPCLIRV